MRSSSRERGSNRGRTVAALLERLEPRSLLTLTPIPALLNFTAGVQPSSPLTIGSFLDSNTTAVPGDFTAAITWGNGVVSAGTVEPTSTPGRFDITGSNLYLTANTYPISVAVSDYQSDSTTIDSTAYVAAPVLTPIGTTAGFTAGVLPSSPVTVGSFLDSNTGAVSGNFTASITWGDGHTSPGTVAAVSGTPGLFSVSGSNLYITPNSYPFSIAVQDNLGNTATIKGTALVASPIDASGTTFTTTPGVPLPGDTVVANFTDVNPNATYKNITAVIKWGDGATGAGTVNFIASNGSTGIFTVTGSHLYAASGTASSYTVGVTIVDPSGQTAPTSSTATSATPLASSGTTFPATYGMTLPSDTVVANFTDTNPAVVSNPNPESQISAVIAWGDGQTSTGKVNLISSSGSSDTFTVTGSHLYAAPSTTTPYVVTVSIVDPSGQIATPTSNPIFTAAIDAAGMTFNAVAGQPYTETVATFTDTSNPIADEVAAQINWGDGQTTNGVVTVANGVYTVKGPHTYVGPGATGSYPVSVTIIDPSGQTATATSKAVITSSIDAAGTTFNAIPGQPYTGTVASFTDSSDSIATKITALINWGDGQTTNGVVSGSNGVYTVTGPHTYSTTGAAGPHVVTVTIIDPSGQTATATSTALTTAAPTIAATGTTFSTTPGQPFSGVVATGTDTNPNATAQNITVVINWGDGQTSEVTPAIANGAFTVTGTHTYYTSGVAGSFPVNVTIVDPSGQVVTASSTAIVLISNLPLTGGIANLASNGPHAAIGFTNTNRPIFSGTGVPFTIVQLYGRHFNADAELPLGEAVVSGTGQWSLTSSPLAIGTWSFTATVTPPGGYPSNMITLTNTDGSDLVYIDLTPKLVRWLSYGQKSVPHPRMVHHSKMAKPAAAEHRKA